jgi:signal peptidase I
VAAPRPSSRSENPVAALRSGKKPAPSKEAGPAQRQKATSWESVRAFLVTVLIFLAIRTFLVEAFRIPSGSMIPTLLVGDWLFVNKLVYGPHVPFTDVNLPGYADPKRGEVVVFVSPYQADEAERGLDPTPTLVKRLVGVPGDTLFMRNAVLHVNGVPAPQGYAAAENPVGDPNETSPLFEWQGKHALAASRFGAAPAQPTHDNWGPLVVPAGHYMMLGDNRYNSKDSRYWGLVPRANLRGRPIFVYYSYRADDSDRPAPFITDIRWGRIGHLIR